MFSGQGAVIVVVFDEPRESRQELLCSYGEVTILGDDGVEIDQARKATIIDCVALIALPKKKKLTKE